MEFVFPLVNAPSALIVTILAGRVIAWQPGWVSKREEAMTVSYMQAFLATLLFLAAWHFFGLPAIALAVTALAGAVLCVVLK